jgi:hypothetical protein
MGGEGEEAGDKEGVEAEVMAKDWLVAHGVGVVLAPSVEGDLGCLREGHLVLILGLHPLLLPSHSIKQRILCGDMICLRIAWWQLGFLG